jgi:hypothetical protein
MEQKSNTRQPEIRLFCCQGKPAPIPVVEGWRQFLRFPEQAREVFWSLLAPAIREPANPSNKQWIESFSREHGLSDKEVVSAMRSCDFLLRQASALDMDAAAFQQDLAALSEEDQQGAEVILSQYNRAKADLRKVIIKESLADHGKVLMGIDWRVDNISASDRGAQLNTTVVFLTLRYRDGSRKDRITFQLTPETVKELKLFCDRFTG